MSTMGDAIPVCSRCGNPNREKVVVVALGDKLADPVPQELHLCPRCVSSFERWFKRRAPVPKQDARRPPSRASIMPTAFGLDNASERGRLRKQPRRILTLMSLSILFLLTICYWTWTFIHSSARLED
jgi:hypothetical protein